MQKDISSVKSKDTKTNIVNLFTGKPFEAVSKSKIVRVCNDTSSIKMLYSNYDNPDRLIAVPLLCWALYEDGTVTGILPWIDEILSCEEVQEKYNVNWEGYYDPNFETIFDEAPEEITAYLTVASRFIDEKVYQVKQDPVTTEELKIAQEIPDSVGTHALLLDEVSETLVLTSVISWVLTAEGELQGMIADDEHVDKLPVLPGDNCLTVSQFQEQFRCFFQRDIAEQIRMQNPETMEAIEMLFAN